MSGPSAQPSGWNKSSALTILSGLQILPWNELGQAFLFAVSMNLWKVWVHWELSLQLDLQTLESWAPKPALLLYIPDSLGPYASS